MYQRARKLHDLMGEPALFFSLVEDQLEAYMVAINALSLVDQKNAWIILPVSLDNVHEVCVAMLSLVGFANRKVASEATETV